MLAWPKIHSLRAQNSKVEEEEEVAAPDAPADTSSNEEMANVGNQPNMLDNRHDAHSFTRLSQKGISNSMDDDSDSASPPPSSTGAESRRAFAARILDAESSSDSSDDEPPIEGITSFLDLSTSSHPAVKEFWESHTLDAPGIADANHPLRKLYVKFSRDHPPSSNKFGIYLIALALSHPKMVFYGLGLLTNKPLWITKALPKTLAAQPSNQLTATTKEIYDQLRRDNKALLKGVEFNSKAISKLVSFMFQKVTTTVKHTKKHGNTWDNASNRKNKMAVDELCIANCIYA
jgi:hypothetical protein